MPSQEKQLHKLVGVRQPWRLQLLFGQGGAGGGGGGGDGGGGDGGGGDGGGGDGGGGGGA